MAEFEEKLNAILGDQDAMGQIMALARSLSGTGDGRIPPPPEPEEQAEACPADPGPELAGLLGDLDPRMLRRGMRVMQELQGQDDRNAALLQALRPFLREERRSRLDRAIQIARTARLIRTALGAMGGEGG